MKMEKNFNDVRRFGPNVRKVREELALDIMEVWGATGKTESQASRYETGKTRISEGIMIAVVNELRRHQPFITLDQLCQISPSPLKLNVIVREAMGRADVLRETPQWERYGIDLNREQVIVVSAGGRFDPPIELPNYSIKIHAKEIMKI